MKVPDGLDSVDAGDVSHGLLLALLQEHHGGCAELPIARLEEHMGDKAGRLWAFAIEPIDDDPTRVRLVVVRVAR